MATLLSAGLVGIDACPIHVEVDISRGMLPRWATVGLAESAVREAKDRVISAIRNSGYEFPFHRITLNLAPADVKKSGTAYDLPIAVGLLAAAGLLPKQEIRHYLLLGELSLDGRLRPVPGVLSIAILAKNLGLKAMVVPQENVWEAHPIKDITVYGAPDLPAVVQFLAGKVSLPQAPALRPALRAREKPLPDFSEVQGQAFAKRALEVAAAGFHHFAMVGPPGSGKSMLAGRLPSILPAMTFEESLTTTKVYSLMGLLKPGVGILSERPFRSPHHTISDAGLIGGGSHPRPGEVSLAHNGVLFLDELTEFRKNVLESLRQPLENHSVTISRARQSLTYPARFLLAAAMNPCPCGQLGNPRIPCRCTGSAIHRYQNRISGPLWDRIDLQIHVPSLAYADLSRKSAEETSEQIRQRVLAGRDRQAHRFKGMILVNNSQMGPKEIRKFCCLEKEGEKILERAIKKWGFSARAYHRILRVARTIADLENSDAVLPRHLQEAIGYRAVGRSKPEII